MTTETPASNEGDRAGQNKNVSHTDRGGDDPCERHRQHRGRRDERVECSADSAAYLICDQSLREGGNRRLQRSDQHPTLNRTGAMCQTVRTPDIAAMATAMPAMPPLISVVGLNLAASTATTMPARIMPPT